MAVDLRFGCLPEHQGPAFRTWSHIIETTMRTVQPNSPVGAVIPGFDINTFHTSAPSEDFIPLNLQKPEEQTNVERTDNQHENGSSNKRSKHSEGGQPNLAQGNSGVQSVSSRSEQNDSSGSWRDPSGSMSIAPWKRRESYPENAAGLHLEIKDFYQYMSPMPGEENMRQDVVNRMQEVITSIWPAAKVEVYGSFKTKLYLPTSDIDLVVFGKWEKLPLWTLEKALVSRDIADPSTIKVLDKASVPIIKLTDKLSKVKVDISFNTETAVLGAELIEAFLKEFKVIPYLFLVLKQFLVQREMNEVFTGGISSYCLMLLLVSFLQRHPREDTRSPDVNVGVLLVEFFELYGRNFNYQRTGIKLKNGGCYCTKDEIMKEMGSEQYPSLLCIEDPVCKGIDIGKSSFGIMRVKEAYEYAYNVLDSALRNRNYFKINPKSTYLSRIIQIPKEVIEYRKWVQQLFNVSSIPSPLPSPIPVSSIVSPRFQPPVSSVRGHLPSFTYGNLQRTPNIPNQNIGKKLPFVTPRPVMQFNAVSGPATFHPYGLLPSPTTVTRHGGQFIISGNPVYTKSGAIITNMNLTPVNSGGFTTIPTERLILRPEIEEEFQLKNATHIEFINTKMNNMPVNVPQSSTAIIYDGKDLVAPVREIKSSFETKDSNNNGDKSENTDVRLRKDSIPKESNIAVNKTGSDTRELHSNISKESSSLKNLNDRDYSSNKDIGEARSVTSPVPEISNTGKTVNVGKHQDIRNVRSPLTTSYSSVVINSSGKNGKERSLSNSIDAGSGQSSENDSPRDPSSKGATEKEYDRRNSTPDERKLSNSSSQHSGIAYRSNKQTYQRPKHNSGTTSPLNTPESPRANRNGQSSNRRRQRRDAKPS